MSFSIQTYGKLCWTVQGLINDKCQIYTFYIHLMNNVNFKQLEDSKLKIRFKF